MTDEKSRNTTRASRHLRVGLTITQRAVHVNSVWLVPEPAVQHHAFGQPIVASVEVNGELSSVEAHPDPRVTRSTSSPGVGHHFENTDKGTLYVSVPFWSVEDLSKVQILVTDLTDVAVGPSSAEGIARLLQSPVDGMRTVHQLSSDDIRASTDWPGIARKLEITEGLT